LVPESIRNVCKASKAEVMLIGLGACGGWASLNIDCNDTPGEPPWLLEKLCLKDAKLRWPGDGDGTGDDGRPGRLGELIIPFLADWATAWVGVDLFFDVKERKKDHSDSNWTSNSEGRGEWSKRAGLGSRSILFST
jgi:hypothetical protein